MAVLELSPEVQVAVDLLERASPEEVLTLELALIDPTWNGPRDTDPEPAEVRAARYVEPSGPLAHLASKNGLTESPQGSNRIEFNRWYWGSDVAAPWCATFLSWGFYVAGLPLPASTPKGFAYTPQGASWFARNNRWAGRYELPLERGQVAFFYWPELGRIGHVGVVDEVTGPDTFFSWEGNTDVAGGRTGGQVLRQHRSRATLGKGGGFGLPAYVLPPPPTPAPPPSHYSEVEGMRLTRHFFQMPTLGADGRGWMGPQNGLTIGGAPVPFARVVSVEPNGPFPPRDGHWPIANLAEHDEGGALVVCSTGTPGFAPGFWVKVLEA